MAKLTETKIKALRPRGPSAGFAENLQAMRETPFSATRCIPAATPTWWACWR